MTTYPYTEDTLVQQTTAEYIEKELSWESVYAYNQETFGPDGTLGRASDREVDNNVSLCILDILFRHVLNSNLKKHLN